MRRSDGYETRARELATLAGHEADSRAAGPGGKMMPAWCTFRDAARAEHLAAEAAALVLPPQAQAFQNAPMRVFGQHDEATIAQMRNCMGVGNVVAGVVCADGHLGYAQPVGGVIAYEKQISISGVGFDIGCGNMAVRLDTPPHVTRWVGFGLGASDSGEGRRAGRRRKGFDRESRAEQNQAGVARKLVVGTRLQSSDGSFVIGPAGALPTND